EVSPVDIGIGLLVLAELHERQSGRTVTIRDYQFAGGAEGLLTQYISRNLELFPKEDQEILLKAMLALRDPITSQRIAEGLNADELAKEAGAEVRRLKLQLDRLAQRDARLLEFVTKSNDSSIRYRLPHERLIPAIYRLTGKLLAEVDQAILKFEKAFQAWQNYEKRSYFLLKGKDLQLIRRFETQIPWGSNQQEKRSFLSLSKRRHRTKYGIAWVVVFGLMMIFRKSLVLDPLEIVKLDREKRVYSAMLIDFQHRQKKLKKLVLINPIDIEGYTCLSSQFLVELSLKTNWYHVLDDLHFLSQCNSL